MTDPRDGLLQLLVLPLRRHHPRPWRVERDWTWEVYDSGGDLVLKCAHPDQAVLLCDLVDKHDAAEEEFNRMMTEALGEGWDQ